MAASERFIMMVEPAEKAGWVARARSVGVSTAEYVRRAVTAYDPDVDPAELREAMQLAEEVRASASRMEAKLDATIAMLREANDPARDERLRAKVRAEFERAPKLDLGRLRGAA